MATALKNKRLSDSNRMALIRFASRNIEATQDRAELNAAYEAAANIVHAAIVARWPQGEMKVLAKWDAARPDPCVYVAVDSYDQFRFCDGDKRIALRPTISDCCRVPVQLDADGTAVYAAYVRARNGDKQQIATRLADFKALIGNTTNFNALAAVWPAVEAMRSEIVGQSAALSILSKEVVARLKADPSLEVTA